MNAHATASEFVLAPADAWDLLAVRRVQKLCFGRDAYDALMLLSMLLNPVATRFKAVAAGQTVGFCAGEYNIRERCGWIVTLGTIPEYTGRGIGAALLLATEKHINRPLVRLTVRKSNSRAITLYERCGYTWTGTFKRYYNDGEDGLVMQKSFG
jgi:ribosomal protein S18 acetylase RimI-like enzyme